MSESRKGWHFWNSAYFLLSVTALMWGANAVAGKIATGLIPPFTLTALRWSFAALCFYFLCRPTLPAAMPIVRRNAGYLFLLGVLGFATFNFGLYGALQYTSAMNVTIEQSAMPMLILLGMVVFYRERATLLQILGAIVAIGGVLFTACHGNVDSLLMLNLNIGDALMMATNLLYAGYSIALKKKPQISWQVLMFTTTFAAAIASVPVAAVEMAYGNLPVVNWLSIGLVAFVVIFPSLIAQTFFVRGVELIGAGRAGLFTNLVPIFGAALAVIVLGERFQLYHAVGLFLVLGGIALAEVSSRRIPLTPPV